MSYKMSKKLTRKELKQRKRRSWKTIKDDNKDLKMSEAKDDYDKAMEDLHKAHDKLVAELEEAKAAVKDTEVQYGKAVEEFQAQMEAKETELKECREECHKKDDEIARLRQGARLAPGPPRRQVAQGDVENGLTSGFSDDDDNNNNGGEFKSDCLDKIKF